MPTGAIGRDERHGRRRSMESSRQESSVNPEPSIRSPGRRLFALRQGRRCLMSAYVLALSCSASIVLTRAESAEDMAAVPAIPPSPPSQCLEENADVHASGAEETLLCVREVFVINLARRADKWYTFANTNKICDNSLLEACSCHCSLRAHIRQDVCECLRNRFGLSSVGTAWKRV